MVTDVTDTARLWIYQSSRLLDESECFLLEGKLKDYTQKWQAHGKPLSSQIFLKHNLFIIVAVDESKEMPSGCSIDALMRFVKELGNEVNVDFFDRLNFAYMPSKDKDIALIHSTELHSAYAQGKISDETLFFDNLVNTYEQLESQWLKPLKASWHYRFVK